MSNLGKSEIREIAHNGLPAVSGRRHKVLILGAGMAGLTAAYELKREGHDPVVLEARNRVGGRVRTIRAPWGDPGLYAEAGAMRIPATHDLTLNYCRRFGLDLIPFTMGNDQCYYYLDGKKFRVAETHADPAILPFELSDLERGKGIGVMWRECIQQFKGMLADRGDDGWDDIVEKYDEYSTRKFLEQAGWSQAAIELYGLLENQEAEMNFSFVEMLREDLGEYYTNLYQIAGGSERLPQAIYDRLKSNVRFGSVVTAIDQGPDQVTAYYETAAGKFSEAADAMIVTLPFAVLRRIEVLKPFSHEKQKAIRQLHYDASTKIFLQCRRRFWEEDEGIFGGGTITDLPIRNLYYPDHGRDTGRGVLLASYTWSSDAERWGSLSPQDRIAEALGNVAVIHPQILREFEAGDSISWHNDPFAGGAFALFEPGQQKRLYKTILEPEGRIYFAGEHASLEHAWIQGAIESGLRAAYQVNQLQA